MIDYGYGVALDLLKYENLESYRKWRNDPLIFRWCRQFDLISEDSQKQWFNDLKFDQFTKMYEIRAGGTFIGVCGLTSIDYINRRGEFSLYLGPEYQGRGLSSPTLKTLFSHGFLNLGLAVIWGETFEDNRAQKVFRDIGMIEECRRRKFYFKEGKHWDALLFSMLDTEFKERRPNW
jgi:RimJ/RimL family protein N-acetyltransferase